MAHVQRLPAIRVPLNEALGLGTGRGCFQRSRFAPVRQGADGWLRRSALRIWLPAGRACGLLKKSSPGRCRERRVGTRRSHPRIMTGAPIPEGADAVVQVEHTRSSGDGSGSSASAHRNHRIAAGKKHSPPRRIDAHGDARLAGGPAQFARRKQVVWRNSGKDTVGVYRRPRVGRAGDRRRTGAGERGSRTADRFAIRTRRC